MQEGVSAAYKAVMKPAEGTVLTVSHRIYEDLGGRTVEVRTQNA